MHARSPARRGDPGPLARSRPSGAGGGGFAIHYWYDPAAGTVEIGPGEDLLVFLSPTHAQGVYGCTVLRKPSEAALRDLRKVLRKLEGR